MYVKIHGLHKLKIRRYTKLVSNLVDCRFFILSEILIGKFWLVRLVFVRLTNVY